MKIKHLKTFILSLFIIVLGVAFISATNSFAAKSKKKHSSSQKTVIHIPPEVVDALKESNIESAIRYLRIEAGSPRSKYLLREMQRVSDYNNKADKFMKRNFKVLYNVGVAYHNLCLFLKSNHIENKKFFKKAERFYLKSAKIKSPSKKAKTRLTLAALYHSAGETKKAEKMFSKADPDLINDAFMRNETLALYYASQGDANSSIATLKKAYKIKPDLTRFWLGISDDFQTISTDQSFQKLLKEWKVEILNRGTASYSSANKKIVY
jgi:tetratricopeptide (TPR) repeat protein